jgi:hypothetical protein
MKNGMKNVKKAQLKEDSISVFARFGTKQNSRENRNMQNGKHLISNNVIQEIQQRKYSPFLTVNGIKFVGHSKCQSPDTPVSVCVELLCGEIRNCGL